jgi:hypothetical protein
MANPTGKGGFGDRPQDINREGLNRRSRESWQATVKRITDMTQQEAIEYVGGPKTKLGKLLKEIPPGLPLKDALVFISIIQYGRDPNPRMLSTLMDREEGKPMQSLEIKDEMTDDERVTRITALLDAARARRDRQATE